MLRQSKQIMPNKMELLLHAFCFYVLRFSLEAARAADMALKGGWSRHGWDNVLLLAGPGYWYAGCMRHKSSDGDIAMWEESTRCADCNCVRSLAAVSKLFYEEIEETASDADDVLLASALRLTRNDSLERDLSLS